MTEIKRWVVYGYPWFSSTLKHAVTVNVCEPDVAVNCHTPIEFIKTKRYIPIKTRFQIAERRAGGE
jgi:hypothetical protein